MRVSRSGAMSTPRLTDCSLYSGDGGLATSARLNGPIGIAPDGSGGIYVCDYANHAGGWAVWLGLMRRVRRARLGSIRQRHPHCCLAVRYVFNGGITSVAGKS